MTDIRKSKIKKVVGTIAILMVIFLATIFIHIYNNQPQIQITDTLKPEDIPEYTGQAYVVINNNEPDLNKKDGQKEFETYSDLDGLGRCGTAYANLSKFTMPKGKRENISSIKPTGWVQAKYKHIDGESLYNRCHLIGWQLSGENANKNNLITGTRYMNTQGMLPIENKVAEYIKSTNNHVLYKVSPVFTNFDLVAKGVHIEALSVEDDRIKINVFCYNIQPKIQIDYATGNSKEV